jgi:hypothetical protein
MVFLKVQYLVPSFFLIHINDLPNIIADPLKPILFADDTGITITNPSPSKFKEDINNIIDNVNDWFRGNSLSLNFDETSFLQFRPKTVMKLTHLCPRLEFFKVLNEIHICYLEKFKE